MVGVLLILWVMCLSLFVKAMDHPAERPVNGLVYMETIGGDF